MGEGWLHGQQIYAPFPCKYDEACYNALNVKKSSNVHIVVKAKK